MAFSVSQIDKAIPLRGRNYFEFLRGKFLNARKRIWATIFIVNPIVKDDEYRAIRTFLKTLNYAQWKNVDVRILLGTSAASDIQIANDTAYQYLVNLEIPVRRFVGKSLHSKYVIIDDDIIVVGSHNWTPGAVSSHNEDSIVLYSKELNIILCEEFLINWEEAAIDE